MISSNVMQRMAVVFQRQQARHSLLQDKSALELMFPSIANI
jgi:hypothetical protein